jgi:hypothetical protein
MHTLELKLSRIPGNLIRRGRFSIPKDKASAVLLALALLLFKESLERRSSEEVNADHKSSLAPLWH